MLTEEEIEQVREDNPALADKLKWVNEKLKSNAVIEEDLTAFFTKVSSDPKKRKKMEELLQETGIDFKIPPSPAVEYADRRVEELNSKIKQMEEESVKSRLNALLEEYDISREEYGDLIKFQKEYSIADGFKAIELYAKHRDGKRELEPTGAISLSSGKGWSREDAYRKTMDKRRKNCDKNVRWLRNLDSSCQERRYAKNIRHILPSSIRQRWKGSYR